MRQICKSDGVSPEMRLSWELVLEPMLNTAEFQKL